MGQRANLVVMRDGAWTLYYDHWAANRLEDELFWGPEDAAAFIEQREPAAPDAWLDEIWCEGAALLDFDDRRLLFFGGEDVLFDVEARRAHLELMAARWPGWRIEWAHGGLTDIVAALGLPIEMSLAERAWADGGRFGVQDEPDWNDILLTVVRGGRKGVLRIAGSANGLSGGPASLLDLVRVGGREAPVIMSELIGGLHVDFDAHSLAYWWAKEQPMIEARVARAWPGWETRWLKDRFEDHLALAGVARADQPDPLARKRERLLSLRRSIGQEARNPAREIDIPGTEWISPMTDETRGSVGDADEKLRWLDEAAARLGLPSLELDAEPALEPNPLPTKARGPLAFLRRLFGRS